MSNQFIIDPCSSNQQLPLASSPPLIAFHPTVTNVNSPNGSWCALQCDSFQPTATSEQWPDIHDGTFPDVQTPREDTTNLVCHLITFVFSMKSGDRYISQFYYLHPQDSLTLTTIRVCIALVWTGLNRTPGHSKRLAWVCCGFPGYH